MSEINITNFVFKKIKIEAKMIKQKHPLLSYTQRLDIASKNIAKMRNYHEVKVHHDRYLSRTKYSLTKKEFTCPYCYMSFCPDLEEDRNEHQLTHLEWEKAEFTLSYLPRSYEEREMLKQKGYDRVFHDYQNKFTLKEIYKGAMCLMRAYFDKSLETAIDGKYWQEHPSLEEYISLVPHNKLLPKNISKQLLKEYGEKPNTNKSIWFPVT